MTYRITAEEENEIDQAFNDRDAARANARRLRSALGEATEKVGLFERDNMRLRKALRRIIEWKTDKEHWQDIAQRALEN